MPVGISGPLMPMELISMLAGANSSRGLGLLTNADRGGVRLLNRRAISIESLSRAVSPMPSPRAPVSSAARASTVETAAASALARASGAPLAAMANSSAPADASQAESATGTGARPNTAPCSPSAIAPAATHMSGPRNLVSTPALHARQFQASSHATSTPPPARRIAHGRCVHQRAMAVTAPANTSQGAHAMRIRQPARRLRAVPPAPVRAASVSRILQTRQVGILPSVRNGSKLGGGAGGAGVILDRFLRRLFRRRHPGLVPGSPRRRRAFVPCGPTTDREASDPSKRTHSADTNTGMSTLTTSRRCDTGSLAPRD